MKHPVRIAAVSLPAALLGVLLAASPGQQSPPATHPTSRPATQPATRPALDERAPASALVRSIEWAHGASTWQRQRAIRTRLTVQFGGRPMLDGVLTYDMHGSRVRIDMDSGQVIIFDGETAWMSPADKPVPMARFHLLTWPYFLAAPFKLDDPGTRISRPRMRMVNGQPHESTKLTFGAGVGDAPDDWYIVYAEPVTNRLIAMGYIVTYGTPAAEAEKEPHAIVYSGWRTLDGVTLSTEWTFHAWSETDGPQGDPIGRASLGDLAFVTPEPGFFDRPEDAVEDPLPGR